ncbi:hypothetical protein [Streptomyces sp. KMM 9044]|uniref:hypothetical protein n=1 Tax=Streptomyces sp. KMM 9044 TaxID=2744474 RepID=UPI003FA702B9
MLPPSAIAGVSLVCALGPWGFTQPMTLRLLAVAAAATAVLGAVVMRHWDAQAGKQVAELTRARASDEWRFEERVAELESDLDESRELRVKLEQRLRAKRTELAGLRNEHAALLRRYAAAEADRATVLEERRMLEIEAAVPARALTAGPSAAESDARATVPAAGTGTEGGATTGPGPGPIADGEEAGRPAAPHAFSSAGSTLFLRANEALARLAGRGEGDEDGAGDDRPAGNVTVTFTDADATPDTPDTPDTEAAEPPSGEAPADVGTLQGVHVAEGDSASAGDGTRSGRTAVAPRSDSTPEGDGPGPTTARKPEQPPEDEAQEQSEAAVEHGSVTASPGPDTGTTPEQSARPAQSAQPALPAPSTPSGSSVRRPSGHFTVPTAVAVVPQAEPVRRPVSDGTFDFFGTQREVEGDADVAEEEAPASHAARVEPESEPADDARGVGQVIDLTAHDEPEPAAEETGAGAQTEGGTKGLRSAVS